MQGTQPLRTDDPRQVGAFRIAGLLGEGGQGAVYRGVGENGEFVAVKLLHARFSGDAKARARFAAELAHAGKVAAWPRSSWCWRWSPCWSAGPDDSALCGLGDGLPLLPYGDAARRIKGAYGVASRSAALILDTAVPPRGAAAARRTVSSRG
ncbi:hypothetical protein GCM10023193_67610 [Planotetraspora kaengkrachanensis]|uniref:Protein kinase domain-containing protein n=1 Tax=Planotetraspora kaengkrachanensis TaxID=575193 RepID=A0A8J3V622_9ACTN|nr:hypothetical protein Pka01_40190 [Planotetraspora kaengkrachanensis]